MVEVSHRYTSHVKEVEVVQDTTVEKFTFWYNWGDFLPKT